MTRWHSMAIFLINRIETWIYLTCRSSSKVCIGKFADPKKLLANPDDLICTYCTADNVAALSRKYLDETIEMQQCVRRALNQNMPPVIDDAHRIIPLQISRTNVAVQIMVMIAGDLDFRVNEIIQASMTSTSAQVKWYRLTDRVYHFLAACWVGEDWFLRTQRLKPTQRAGRNARKQRQPHS